MADKSDRNRRRRRRTEHSSRLAKADDQDATQRPSQEEGTFAPREGRRYLYSPVLQREQWLSIESKGLLDRLSGRVAPLVAHFKQRKLTKKDIAELDVLIAELDDAWRYTCSPTRVSPPSRSSCPRAQTTAATGWPRSGLFGCGCWCRQARSLSCCPCHPKAIQIREPILRTVRLRSHPLLPNAGTATNYAAAAFVVWLSVVGDDDDHSGSAESLRTLTFQYDAQARMVSIAAPACQAPCLSAFGRPRIILPADFDTRYSARERALMLAHEQAHLERRDILTTTIGVMWFCALSFDPLMLLGP